MPILIFGQGVGAETNNATHKTTTPNSQPQTLSPPAHVQNVEVAEDRVLVLVCVSQTFFVFVLFLPAGPRALFFWR